MVIWVPDWPVVAAAVAAGRSPDDPIAVLEKGKVLATSAAARAEGVRRGQRARDAQSRCPELVVLKYDPVTDARAFDPVITCLEAITPGVQVIRPGMCALKARGPARFYGGEDAAATKLLDRLETFDVHGSRVGIADGPFAAEQAARASSARTRVHVVPVGGSPGFLAPLSVDLLERPVLTDLLRRLGLRSLGAFARLSGTEVLTRFGPEGAFAHRLARGGDDRPVTGRDIPPELTRVLDFEPAVDRVDQVAFAVRAIADDLIARLTELGLVCTTLRVEVGTESGRIHERDWLHPRWFTAADVVDRVRWQLQGSGTATSELTSPVVRVRLIPDQADPLGTHADGLWGGGPDERIHRALSRVQSMLGHGAVVSPVLGGGRTPTTRQSLIPWGDPPTPPRPPTHPWPGTTTTTHPPPPNPTPNRNPNLSSNRNPNLSSNRNPNSSSGRNLRADPSSSLSSNRDPGLRADPTPNASSSLSSNRDPGLRADPSPNASSSLSSNRDPGLRADPTPNASSSLNSNSNLGSSSGLNSAPSSNPAFAFSSNPSRWPTLAPTTVFPTPIPAEVLSADGTPISITPRGALSATPTTFTLNPTAPNPLPQTPTPHPPQTPTAPTPLNAPPSTSNTPPNAFSTPRTGSPRTVTPLTSGAELASGVRRTGFGGLTVGSRARRGGLGSRMRLVGGSGGEGEVAEGNEIYGIVDWAGPWISVERWWDEAGGSREARFQFQADDTRAWLFILRENTWLAEATYD
ncbi:hypothetical protein GCM10010522_07790 [Kribbella solani]